MANYTFLDTTTNKEFDISMPISELDDYKKANPHLTQQLRATAIADPTRLGLKKPDGGFRDLLKDMKKTHRRSSINTW